MQEFDVVVIGSGPGGYVAAIRSAQLKLKTACIEKGAIGGTCLNVGCIPSKALLHTSEFYWKCGHEAKSYGVIAEQTRCDFSAMMARKNTIVSSFQEGIAGLFKKNHISYFKGTASFVSPTRIAISPSSSQEVYRNNLKNREFDKEASQNSHLEQATIVLHQGASEDEKFEKKPTPSKTDSSDYFGIIQARHVIIATGSEPTPLPFLPFDEKRIVSSTGALALSTIPKRLIVIGAGIIGVELGSVYKRLGSDVTFIEFMDRICPTLEESLSKELFHQLNRQGMQFHLSSKVTAAQIQEKEILLKVNLPDASIQEMGADVVLICIGRRPYSAGLGLDRAGITLTKQGMIPIDGHFRTQTPHIFAIGDIVDGPMLAHKAEEEGMAAAEIIAGHSPKVCYAAVPSVVYTQPEVASVGLTGAQAKEFGLKFKTGIFAFKANSRARCTGEDVGFVSLYAEEETNKIIGVHIIGVHASELIAEGALAIQKQLTLDDIIATPHSHPTLSEAIREAALDVEKRAINK